MFLQIKYRPCTTCIGALSRAAILRNFQISSIGKISSCRNSLLHTQSLIRGTAGHRPKIYYSLIKFARHIKSILDLLQLRPAISLYYMLDLSADPPNIHLTSFKQLKRLLFGVWPHTFHECFSVKRHSNSRQDTDEDLTWSLDSKLAGT